MTKSFAKRSLRLDVFLKLFLILVLCFAGLRYFLGSQEEVLPDGEAKITALASRVDFAKCLMEKGWVMYGVNACEYCQTQKKMFGQAFENIRYVDCDFEGLLCREKNITHYPVWEHGDRLMPGAQSLDRLARESGCKI